MTTFTAGHAVLVGVGGNLPGTVNDAKWIRNILTDPARCAYPTSQVKTLLGADASRAAILSALDGLSEVGPDATVVVYFSGHGMQVESADDGQHYIVPHGFSWDAVEDTAISGTELRDRLDTTAAGKILLLLDCCLAGGLHPPSAAIPVKHKAVPITDAELLGRGRGLVVIASSQDDETSIAWPHISAFTYALVEGLCGIGTWARDGLVHVAALAMYTARRVPWLTDDEQHPTLHFQQADNYPVAFYSGGAKALGASPLSPPPVARATLPVATAVRRRIRNLLMRLYPTEGDARVLAKDAGFLPGSVPVSTSAKVIWDGILEHAELSGAMLRLIEAVDEDGYAEGDEWRHVREDCLLLLGQRRGPVTSARGRLRVLPSETEPDYAADADGLHALLRRDLPYCRPPAGLTSIRAAAYIEDARSLAARAADFARAVANATPQMKPASVDDEYRLSRAIEDVVVAADVFTRSLDAIATVGTTSGAGASSYDEAAERLTDAVLRLKTIVEAVPTAG